MQRDQDFQRSQGGFYSRIRVLVCGAGEGSIRLGGQFFLKKNRRTRKEKVGGGGFLVPVADLTALKTGNAGTAAHPVLVTWTVKYPGDIRAEAEMI